MIKLRVEGLPEEVRKCIKKIRESTKVLQESRQYKNRNKWYVI